MQREELVSLLGAKMRPGVANDPRILVDTEDAWILEYKWTVVESSTGVPYAVRFVRRQGKQPAYHLHRAILVAPSTHEVDHINGNGLDNRRCNLRLATHRQNLANQRRHTSNTSGRKGVCWDSRKNKWRARIKSDGRLRFLGLFTDLDEAARAYDKAAIDLFGEYATTNEMLGLVPAGANN